MGGARSDQLRIAVRSRLRMPQRWAAARSVIRAARAALVWLFATAAPAGGTGAEDELRIIPTGHYPPFVYADATGHLTGFEIDVADALCAVLAERCVFLDTPFEEAIPAL